MFIFKRLIQSIKRIATWMEINIYGNDYVEPTWNESDVLDIDTSFTTEFRHFIREACVQGGLPNITKKFYESALEPLFDEFKQKNNNKKVFKLITLDDYISSAPSEKMANQLNEDFHNEWKHTWHVEAFVALKKKVEQFYETQNDSQQTLVLAYCVNNTHADYRQNLVNARDWNQYHCEAFGFQFTNPNHASPLYIDCNGTYDPNNEHSKKTRSMYMYIIYIYIYIYLLLYP